MSVKKEPWEAKAEAKRADTYAKIPKDWLLDQADLTKANKRKDLTGPFIEMFLTAEEVAITSQPSISLVAKVREGDYSSLAVTRAFCKRTAIAQQINNCLHEIFFDEAIQRARELDEYFAKHGTVIGPLHGLPVSLKDQFHVKGNDTSMGFIGWLDTYEGNADPKLVRNVDSLLVTELMDQGAVLYCKTSLPQTLIFGETMNNLIGTTLNPHNMNLSCGGSSGGEGALAALGGSPVGIGTDIGGSVRIPAAFCGINSIKPSHSRFPYRNVGNTQPGQTTYASSIGFMSSTLDSLHLIMSSVLSTQPWLRDPHVLQLPWRQHVIDATLARASATGMSTGGKPLKLGVFWNDGVVTPHPPIQRGMRLTVDAVKEAGHKVVEWSPPSHTTASRLHGSFLLADGGHDVRKQLALSGEPVIPPLRKAFEKGEPLPLLEYEAQTVKARDYEEEYMDYWNSTADEDGQLVDAVIMPVAPHAAVIPGKYYHLAYAEVINLLDYSAVVIPVTKAQKEVDEPDTEYQPKSEKDRRNWDAYDAEIYDGALVGLQLVGRKLEEEKIWAVGKIVQNILENASSEKGKMKL